MKQKDGRVQRRGRRKEKKVKQKAPVKRCADGCTFKPSEHPEGVRHTCKKCGWVFILVEVKRPVSWVEKVV